MIRPDESSLISVRATDPDAADSRLVFAWSAPSGSFDPSDKPVTRYRCFDLGEQQLVVTVRDRHDCTSTLIVTVQCVAN